MTDEEHNALQTLSDKVDKIHAAFFELPPGSPDHDQPLIAWLNIMSRSYQRTAWAGRLVVYVTLTLGSCFAAFAAIRSGLNIGDK